MIPHSRATLPTPMEWHEITGWLHPGWIADGPCVAQFEREAAVWLGVAEGVSVCSGSEALHLALAALDLRPGAEVLIPAYACGAVANSVRQVGATPIPVDCSPGSVMMSPEDAHYRRSARTGAVVVAHLFGQITPLEPFLELGVPVIEDCAQSFGSPAHRFGRVEGRFKMTSFFATKMMTTGHGGLVVATDPSDLARLRDLTEYDNRDDDRVRFSLRMSEMQAALGRWQLQRLPGFVATRSKLAARWTTVLGCRDEPAREPSAGVAYRYVLRNSRADDMLAWFQARQVGVKRPVYRPLSAPGDCPEAEAAWRECLSIPIYPSLTESETEAIQTALAAAPF